MPVLKDPRQEMWAQAYAAECNSLRAAKALKQKYTDASANMTNKIQKHPQVKARVHEIIKTRFDAVDITAKRVMTELARVAFASAKDIFDERGELIPVHELSDDAAATITGIDVEIRRQGKGPDAELSVTKKVRRADKMAALGILAKHFKIVGDEGDGVNALASALADRLKAARSRVVPQDVEDAREVQAEAAHLPPPPPSDTEGTTVADEPPTPKRTGKPRGRPPGSRGKPHIPPAPEEPQPKEHGDEDQLW